VTQSNDEFLEQGRQRWRDALATALGPTPLERSEWTDLNQMSAVLGPFTKKGVGHLYLPTGGGQSPTGVRLGREQGTLEFRIGKRTAYVIKPRRLIVHYFNGAPAQSFVFIEGAKLKPSGIYDRLISDSEELVEVSPGDLRDRAVWDRGFADVDEYGDELPLPDSARIVVRFLRGGFAIVGHGSVWNGPAATYDGEHDRLGEAEMRKLIQMVIDKRGLKE
jgi:hypothetical protein